MSTKIDLVQETCSMKGKDGRRQLFVAGMTFAVIVVGVVAGAVALGERLFTGGVRTYNIILLVITCLTLLFLIWEFITISLNRTRISRIEDDIARLDRQTAIESNKRRAGNK